MTWTVVVTRHLGVIAVLGQVSAVTFTVNTDGCLLRAQLKGEQRLELAGCDLDIGK